MAEKPLGDKFIAIAVRQIALNVRRIVVLCFIVAVISSVWALTRTPRWGAWAAAIVPGETTASITASAGALGLGDAAGALGALGSGVLPEPAGVDITLATQILGSRSVQERVILKYDLISRYRALSMERAVKKFGDWCSVTLSPEGIIFVTAQGSSRTEAAAIVNDMILFANQELSTLVTSRARRSRIQTESALAVAYDSLEASRDAMELFRTSTGLVFPEEQASSMMDVMAAIESEMISAGAVLQGLSENLSSQNAIYSQASAQYRYLEDALRIRSTTGDSLSVFPVMDSIPYYLREYEALVVDIETRSAVYLLLRQELETLRIQESKDSPSIEIIVPATPEFLRAYPKRTVMVLTYTAVAFILCLIWIVFLTWLRSVLDSPNSGPFIKSTFQDVRNQFRRQANGSPKK
jgi:capsule polysaccharide export protein KpsE/RkpR